MDIQILEKEIAVAGISDFDPVHIFECGQCFRWNADANGVYSGVALGRAAKVRKEGDTLYISGSQADFESVWYDYFDLGRDYAAIRESLCIDDYMRVASDFGAGIRILKQDKWEALCSFIISQCNNIARIKKIIETMCSLFGEPFEFEGDTYYDFPTAERIAALGVEDLAPLRSGYRAAYIIDAARAVASGELDLEQVAHMDSAEAIKRLKTLNGVGDKVANCIILFGLQKLDAFPMDVWMKRAVKETYGSNFNPAVFGEYAGIAQQYMFYYARSQGRR